MKLASAAKAIRFWLCLLALVSLGSCAFGQPQNSDLGREINARHGGVDSQGVFREILDRNTNLRWLLTRNERDRSGPGHWFPIPASSAESALNVSLPDLRTEPSSRCFIQAGDRVIVEEHTRTVEGRYEATALDPAVCGGRLKVRLRLAGKIVGAIAEASGRALLAFDEGAHQ
jgi:hypothetical protein